LENRNGGYDPFYSPDGESIMYGYGYDVYLYTIDGGGVQQITPGDSWYQPVDWGNNSESVVVKKLDLSKGGFILYDIDLDTLEMIYLFNVTGDIYGRFSLKYDRFLATSIHNFDFDNYYEIRLYDTATWEYEVLFECVNYGYVGSGGWSKNGEEVLLVHKAVAKEEFIREYNLSTGDIEYATWTPRKTDADWNGTLYVADVIYSATEDKIYYKAGPPDRIWVVDAP